LRILLDECVDWRLGLELELELESHEVRTPRQLGWSSLKNGDLLALAALEFDAFATIDRSLGHQQNLERFDLAVIVLHARTSRLADLSTLVPELLGVLESAPRGRATVVG